MRPLAETCTPTSAGTITSMSPKRPLIRMFVSPTGSLRLREVQFGVAKE